MSSVGQETAENHHGAKKDCTSTTCKSDKAALFRFIEQQTFADKTLLLPSALHHLKTDLREGRERRGDEKGTLMERKIIKTIHCTGLEHQYVQHRVSCTLPLGDEGERVWLGVELCLYVKWHHDHVSEDIEFKSEHFPFQQSGSNYLYSG